MSRSVKEPEYILQDLVRCNVCNDFLWFSKEGYLTCRCEGFPYREVSPEMVLDKILDELRRNLENPEFLNPLTAVTNQSVKDDGFRFSEPEILKIVQKLLENAVASGDRDILRRTLSRFVDEVTIDHAGALEIYMVPTAG